MPLPDLFTTMPDLFAPAFNSPRATLTAGISATDTALSVDNAAILPDAPNLLTIGTEEDAETVKILSKNGNVISVRRGEQGAARAWAAGEFIARNFTAKDHADMIAWLRHIRAVLGALYVFTAVCTYDADENLYTLELLTPEGISQAQLIASLPPLFTVMAKFPNAYEPEAKFGVGSIVYEPKYAGFEENDVQLITFDQAARKCFFRVGGGSASTAAYCGVAYVGATYLG